jgi:hypothetical protein
VNDPHLAPVTLDDKWFDELATLRAEFAAVADALNHRQTRIKKIRDPWKAMRLRRSLIADYEAFIAVVGPIRELLVDMIARAKVTPAIH